MAHVNVIHFYFLLWWKETRVFSQVVFSNVLFAAFFLTNNDWGWIMSIPLLTSIFELLFVDFSDTTRNLFQVCGVSRLKYTYCKMLAFFPVALLGAMNAYLILYSYNYSVEIDSIFIISSYACCLYSFFYFVDSKPASVLIVVISYAASSQFARVFPEKPYFHLIVILVLASIHLQYYRNAKRGYF